MVKKQSSTLLRQDSNVLLGRYGLHDNHDEFFNASEELDAPISHQLTFGDNTKRKHHPNHARHGTLTGSPLERRAQYEKRLRELNRGANLRHLAAKSVAKEKLRKRLGGIRTAKDHREAHDQYLAELRRQGASANRLALKGEWRAMRKQEKMRAKALEKTVDWQKVLGTYDPSKGYQHYKRVYNAKLAAVATEEERVRLRAAWRAMRTKNITQNKRGLDRQLHKVNADRTGLARATARQRQRQVFLGKKASARTPQQMRALEVEHAKEMKAIDARYGKVVKQRQNLKDTFRAGYLDTGKVALPAHISRKTLAAAIGELYDGANKAMVVTHRQSMTKYIQAKFIDEFPHLVDLGLTLKSKKVAAGAAGAAGLVALQTATVLGAPAALTAIAGAWAAAYVGSKVLADPTSLGPAATAVGTVVGKVVGPTFVVGETVVNGAVRLVTMSAKTVIGLVHGEMGLAKVYAILANRVHKATGRSDVKTLTGVLSWCLERFCSDLFEFYVGFKADVRQVPTLLKMHGSTIIHLLNGEDKSLKPLAMDAVNLMFERDLQAIAKQILPKVEVGGRQKEDRLAAKATRRHERRYQRSSENRALGRKHREAFDAERRALSGSGKGWVWRR